MNNFNESNNEIKENNGDFVFAGISTKYLAKKYNTPLYLYNQNEIESVCKTFVDAINDNYGLGMIAYASKAFCCKEIYRIISKFGMGCDVVSLGELYTAYTAGFDFNKIVFHGNNKTYDEIKFAVDNNVGLIVIDSFDEVDTLSSYLKTVNKKQNVLIRVDPGIEAHTHHYIQTAKTDSKFGFLISNGDSDRIIDYIINNDNLVLKGLHCHIGSQIFEPKSFLIEVDKMLDYYKFLKEKKSLDLEVLDLGGGFGITYTDLDPIINNDFYKNTIKSIIDKVKEKIALYNLKKPYLIFEPGRAIVGKSGITLYTVGNTKEITGIKNYLSIDGGMFENPRFALYQAQYKVIPITKMNEKPTMVYTVAGKCCESGDIIAENCPLPKMKKGDLIAVLSTGAYNYSMASNYNRNFIPSVVMIKNSEDREIIKRQNLDDLIKQDI